MSKTIKITCLNTNITKKYTPGITLLEIAKDLNIKLKNRILGARVNNTLTELDYQIFRPKIIEFIDITNIDGYKMYQRSLSFVLVKAVKDIFPKYTLKIEHSISKGFYCEIKNKLTKLKHEDIFKIADKMREIIKADIKFVRTQEKTKDAIELFEKHNLTEKAKLLKTRPTLFTSVYSLAEDINHFYGYLVPSTGYLELFDLIPYYNGMLLRFPIQSNPSEIGNVIKQEKLYDIFQEYVNWVNILDISSVGSINEKIHQEKGGELIKFSEAIHGKKVSRIADIIKEFKDTKIILIAGPTSSGKTTFSKRLSVQLKIIGIKPVLISLDNYFVNREDTPKDRNGEYNYETINALDVKAFNNDMLDLINEKKIKLSKFNFEIGKREQTDKEIKITNENVIIVEGIHGLNPKLTERINDRFKFKIYVSALTQINIDLHNRISTTDNRLLRRIIRDYQYRGYSAVETLNRWNSVRSGEEKYIFPYQEEADIMFNSALLYEHSVLKKYIEPLLKKIPETEYNFSEAQRLLKFLSYFNFLEDKEIPPTSILREFLSGSSFTY